MKHRKVPASFIRGRYAPILYLDFAEGVGAGQGALITGSTGTGGTAVGADGLVITDQQLTVALNLLPNFNPLRGTMFIEARPNAAGSFNRAVSLNTVDANEEIYIGLNAGAARAFVTDGGVAQASYNLGSWATAMRKVAISWDAGNFNAALNGVSGTPDTAGTLPTLTNLDIGHIRGVSFFPGTIRRVALWETNFSSDVLQNLTA